jgi:hypothetical protein
MSDFPAPETMTPEEREAEIAQLREERERASRGEINRHTTWWRWTLYRLTMLEAAQGNAPEIVGLSR